LLLLQDVTSAITRAVERSPQFTAKTPGVRAAAAGACGDGTTRFATLGLCAALGYVIALHTADGRVQLCPAEAAGAAPAAAVRVVSSS
jgi:hypothetical protein